MPFGLRLGTLSLALYEGRAANKFGLLTGQIVAVDNPRLCNPIVALGGSLLHLLIVIVS